MEQGKANSNDDPGQAMNIQSKSTPDEQASDLKDYRVIFCGITRDDEEGIPAVLNSIEETGRLFGDYCAVIFENDSVDSTKQMLLDWKRKTGDKVNILSETHAFKKRPNLQFLAYCRNQYLREIDKSKYDNYTHVIMVDFDMKYGWPALGVINSFQQPDWDVMAANGICTKAGHMWDAFAFRTEALNKPYDSKKYGSIKNYWPILNSSEYHRIYPPGSPIVPVYSAFGGLCIYKKEVLAGASYDVTSEDCEHVSLHRSILEKGGKIYMNPSMIIKYSNYETGSDSMSQQPRLYNIGSHSIILPPGHMLDQYQARWKRYDVVLGEIARIMYAKYPDLTVIDIGANIGDTAALICKYNLVPVLCIEGHPGFLTLLEANASRVNSEIEIEGCFLGTDGSTVQFAQIEENKGTATLVGKPGTGNDGVNVPMKSLKTVLAEHPVFSGSRLIKIDTDGMDFRILLESKNHLQESRPVLYFEYDPKFQSTGDEEALHAIAALVSIGYTRFLIYDNYGNYMMTAYGTETFQELNAYLRSNIKNGFAVYYFDVCALTDDDEDLFEEIHAYELSV